MNYKQVSITVGDSAVSDILIALLADDGYEGFEENEDSLIAFIPTDHFDEQILLEILRPYDLSFSIAEIAKTNWNKEWEENFEPVVVDDFCTVRAHFHDILINTPYEIVITPKMSFGTGHHATTQCMISMMRRIEFVGKSVLDFGTGTGILAILAKMLGAKEVVAIDNEEWACDNALENIQRNEVGNVTVHLGALDKIGDENFDIILANINRHILLESMERLYQITQSGGMALLSGLLDGDRDVVLAAANGCGFRLMAEDLRGKWIALLFTK